MKAAFIGFDSAWGENNTGAICELVLQDDGSLMLREGHPIPADWGRAIEIAGQVPHGILNVWAVDQPICVPNESGCRPVEADLARALMAGFGLVPSRPSAATPVGGQTLRSGDL